MEEKAKSEKYFQEFVSSVNPPKLPLNVVKLLYVMTAFPQHLGTVYSNIFEGRIDDDFTKRIEKYIENQGRTSMKMNKWKSILNIIKDGNISKDIEDRSSFLEKNPIMKRKFEFLSKSKRGEVVRDKWTPSDISLVYLTLYQPNLNELIPALISRADRDLFGALKVFSSEVPHIDPEELSNIVSTIVN